MLSNISFVFWVMEFQEKLLLRFTDLYEFLAAYNSMHDASLELNQLCFFFFYDCLFILAKAFKMVTKDGLDSQLLTVQILINNVQV